MKRGPKPGTKTQTALFKKLRARIVELGMSHRELSLLINRCHAAVSKKMRGVCQWTLEEMYSICNVLDIPTDQLHLYFPRDGK